MFFNPKREDHMSTINTKTQAIQEVLQEPRNGANKAIRYSLLFRRFFITDGAQQLAEAAGCYWLLDILASELEPLLLKAINTGEVATVHVYLHKVEGCQAAMLRAVHGDGELWVKAVKSTDFPAGDWHLFEVGTLEWDMQAQRALSVIATLPSEH